MPVLEMFKNSWLECFIFKKSAKFAVRVQDLQDYLWSLSVDAIL